MSGALSVAGWLSKSQLRCKMLILQDCSMQSSSQKWSNCVQLLEGKVENPGYGLRGRSRAAVRINNTPTRSARYDGLNCQSEMNSP